MHQSITHNTTTSFGWCTLYTQVQHSHTIHSDMSIWSQINCKDFMKIGSVPFQRQLDKYTNKRTVGISCVHWPRCMVWWVEFIFYILNVLFATFDFEIIIMQRPGTKWCSYFSKLSQICINIQVYAYYVLFCLMHVINDIQRKFFVFKWLIWQTKTVFC